MNAARPDVRARFDFADGVRAVLFDAGNTLLWLDHARMAGIVAGALGPVTHAGVRAADLRARPRLDPHLRTTSRREGAGTSRRYAELIVEELGAADAKSPVTNATTAVNAAAARAVEAVDALMHVWRSLWVCPPDDAAATLDLLAARGLLVGCVSNSDGTVHTLLEAAGLASRLRCVVDSGAVGIEKPDPRIFLLAAERLRVPPGACVYLGDFLSLDVEGARAAGMHGVLIDPDDTWAQAAAHAPRVRSLTEFAARLA